MAALCGEASGGFASGIADPEDGSAGELGEHEFAGEQEAHHFDFAGDDEDVGFEEGCAELFLGRGGAPLDLAETEAAGGFPAGLELGALSLQHEGGGASVVFKALLHLEQDFDFMGATEIAGVEPLVGVRFFRRCGPGDFGREGFEDGGVDAVVGLQEVPHVFVECDDLGGVAISEAHEDAQESDERAYLQFAEADADLGIEIHRPVKMFRAMQPRDHPGGNREAGGGGERKDGVDAAAPEASPAEEEMGEAFMEKAGASAARLAVAGTGGEDDDAMAALFEFGAKLGEDASGRSTGSGAELVEQEKSHGRMRVEIAMAPTQC